MSDFKLQQKAVQRHLILISNLCIYGGILFVMWGVAIYFITGKSLEVWPARIGISSLLVGIGVVIKRKIDLSLQNAEWVVTAIGMVSVFYACYVTWIAGLDPTWVTGTTLIIVGILGYLTGMKQTISFAVFSVMVGGLSLYLQKTGQLMEPGAVMFNFFTAASLGLFSSVQRNRYLLDLIQLETKQNIILSTMREGVVLHLASGIIVSANESASRILGLTESQIIGKTSLDPQWKTFMEDGSVCSPEIHPSTIALATGRPVENFPMKLIKPDGSISFISVTAIPTFEPGNSTPMAAVVTIQDVTDQREKEEKIRSQEVSLMLSSRLAGLGEMAAGIAHEINNPLAVIAGRVSMIEDALSANDVDLEVMKRHIHSVGQTATRIAKIVNSMRSLSRQTMDDNFITTSINSILEDIFEISRERLRSCDVDLQIEHHEDIEFDCHPGQISQVILNLINNAVDAIEGHDSKWIRVSMVTDQSSLFLKVTDSGRGIPAELKTKILQPFFTTKDIGKGTGLGLSLVQTIIRKHGGEFYINDRSVNTEFVIRLPLKQETQTNKSST